jgi:hypothetical protein
MAPSTGAIRVSDAAGRESPPSGGRVAALSNIGAITSDLAPAGTGRRRWL